MQLKLTQSNAILIITQHNLMHLKQLCATLCVTHATSQSVLLTWLQQTCLDYETLEGEGKRFQQSRSSFISSWWTYMLPLWWHITTLHLSIWNECPLEFLPCEDLGFQCHLAFCPLGWRGWGVGVHINTPTYYHMWPSLSPCSTYMCQCIWALHSKSNQRKHIHTRKNTNILTPRIRDSYSCCYSVTEKPG